MKKIPPLLIAAFTSIVSGFVLVVLNIALPLTADTTKSLYSIASGLIILGCGEILNHPRQIHLEYVENKSATLRQIPHHSRNPCPLGNLMVIIGLLLFFIGIAGFISF